MVDVKNAFVKALLIGIKKEGIPQVQEDLFYASLLNIADIEQSDKIDVAAAKIDPQKLEYKILVNVERIGKDFDMVDQKELITLFRAIIKHELWHIIGGHLLIKKIKKQINGQQVEFEVNDEFTRLCLNLATDSVINENLEEPKRLEEAGKVVLASPEDFFEGNLPKDKYVFVGESRCARAELGKDYTAEELAAWLYLKYKLPEAELPQMQGASQGDESNSSTQISQQQSNVQETNVQQTNVQQTNVQRTNQPFQVQESAGRNYLNNDFEPLDLPEEVAEAVKEIARRIIQERLTEIGRIKGSEKILSNEVKEISRKSKLNWKKLLQNAINGAEVFEDVRLNKHRLNKRYGTPPKIARQHTPNIRVLVDTSGSVDDATLDEFLSEVVKIAEFVGTVELFLYSTSLSKQINVRRHTDSVVVHERGGTELAVALSQLPRKPADLLIIFTDGFDDFPTEQVKKITEPIIFVFPKDHNSTFREVAKKYAKIIIIE